MLQPAVFDRIRKLLKNKRSQIALVWLGTPCTTWSRARKEDGGPRPLRDDHQGLYGLGHLTPAEQSKIDEGNALLRVSEELISLCIELSIPWALENPWTSRIWLTKQLQQWISMHHFIRVDFCGFQMPWRKATGILFGFIPNFLQLAITCDPLHGRCSFTNRKHIILTGKDSSGQWMTRRAQPYPLKLCQRIATLVAEHI